MKFKDVCLEFFEACRGVGDKCGVGMIKFRIDNEMLVGVWVLLVGFRVLLRRPAAS